MGVVNWFGHTPNTCSIAMRLKRRRRLSRIKKPNAGVSGSESHYAKKESINYVSSEEESESAGEGDASETKAMRELVLQQNRKKKKSGGFQSMGTCNSITLTCVAITSVKL